MTEGFLALFGWLCLLSAFHYWKATTMITGMVIGPMAWVDPSDKAMNLMLRWLTPKQRKEFLENECFYVKGNFTGKTYRIKKATAPFNVEVLKPNGSTETRLCFVPQGCAFVGDIMLAQKIGLETNEKHVLKIANNYNRWHMGLYPATGDVDMA